MTKLELKKILYTDINSMCDFNSNMSTLIENKNILEDIDYREIFYHLIASLESILYPINENRNTHLLYNYFAKINFETNYTDFTCNTDSYYNPTNLQEDIANIIYHTNAKFLYVEINRVSYSNPIPQVVDNI